MASPLRAESKLLVGFDSAWTASNSGALVGVVQTKSGSWLELGPPQIANYLEAEAAILEWQAEHQPGSTIILLDQPTIVANKKGQRPVESIIGSAVSRRYGGMQPANASREEMFGAAAPVWPFLNRFGGPADPERPSSTPRVFETYPVLALIALDWVRPDLRPTGRLPKYNPARMGTFSLADWQFICEKASAAFAEQNLPGIHGWLQSMAEKERPRKQDQDCLDACLCLLVALAVVQPKECLMIGNIQTGYIIVPYNDHLAIELEIRCKRTGRVPIEWVRSIRP